MADRPELQFLEWAGDLDQATRTALAVMATPDGGHVLVRLHLDGTPFTGEIRIGGRVLTYESGRRIAESAAPKDTAQERAQERQDKLKEAAEKAKLEREKYELDVQQFQQPLLQRAAEADAKRRQEAIKQRALQVDDMLTKQLGAGSGGLLQKQQWAQDKVRTFLGTGQEDNLAMWQALQEHYDAQVAQYHASNEPVTVRRVPGGGGGGGGGGGMQRPGIDDDYWSLSRQDERRRQGEQDQMNSALAALQKRLLEAQAQKAEQDLPANYLNYAGGAYSAPPARR